MEKKRYNPCTLRIKKIYLDQIVLGEKRFEYRDYKLYYISLFKNKPTHFLLHYQTSRQVLVEIVEIRKIKTPQFVLDSGIPFSPFCFRIKIGRVVSVSK